MTQNLVVEIRQAVNEAQPKGIQFSISFFAHIFINNLSVIVSDRCSKTCCTSILVTARHGPVANTPATAADATTAAAVARTTLSVQYFIGIHVTRLLT